MKAIISITFYVFSFIFAKGEIAFGSRTNNLTTTDTTHLELQIVELNIINDNCISLIVQFINNSSQQIKIPQPFDNSELFEMLSTPKLNVHSPPANVNFKKAERLPLLKIAPFSKTIKYEVLFYIYNAQAGSYVIKLIYDSYTFSSSHKITIKKDINKEAKKGRIPYLKST